MASIVVIGDTHNAWVSSACLASKGHDVTLVSREAFALENEPGLGELVSVMNKLGQWCAQKEAPSDQADFVWLAHDTPLDETGAPDVQPLLPMIRMARDVSHRLIISSQVPIGFCHRLDWRRDSIAYVPENMRIGNGIRGFLEPDRLVVGAENREYAGEVALLWRSFPGDTHLFRCSLETAEMIKHATNAFLATSISFANEIAAIGRDHDVDMSFVRDALRADRRIGPKAYVEAGRPFTGHTLKRDLRALQKAAAEVGGCTPLIDAVLAVNERIVGEQ